MITREKIGACGIGYCIVSARCELMCGELGLNLTAAINVFLRKSLSVGGFPFEVRLDAPSQKTVAAMRESERIAWDPSAKRYSDVGEALAALKD